MIFPVVIPAIFSQRIQRTEFPQCLLRQTALLPTRPGLVAPVLSSTPRAISNCKRAGALTLRGLLNPLRIRPPFRPLSLASRVDPEEEQASSSPGLSIKKDRVLA